MALVKFGGGITQMAGSIGGTTFAKNRYGNYSRARTKPVNPNTDLQRAVREAVTVATERWSQTLTAPQRAAWDLYASNVVMTNRLGETIHLSGYNHYIRSASLYIRNGTPTIDDGPVIFEIPGADNLLAVSGTEAPQAMSIAFDITRDWVNEDTGRMFLFQGQPQNAQRNFFAGPWRYFHSIKGDSVAPPASPEAATVSYPIAEGQKVWIYARILRADGRVSQPFRTEFFCAA